MKLEIEFAADAEPAHIESLYRHVAWSRSVHDLVFGWLPGNRQVSLSGWYVDNNPDAPDPQISFGVEGGENGWTTVGGSRLGFAPFLAVLGPSDEVIPDDFSHDVEQYSEENVGFRRKSWSRSTMSHEESIRLAFRCLLTSHAHIDFRCVPREICDELRFEGAEDLVIGMPGVLMIMHLIAFRGRSWRWSRLVFGEEWHRGVTRPLHATIPKPPRQIPERAVRRESAGRGISGRLVSRRR